MTITERQIVKSASEAGTATQARLIVVAPPRHFGTVHEQLLTLERVAPVDNPRVEAISAIRRGDERADFRNHSTLLRSPESAGQGVDDDACRELCPPS